MNAQEYDIMLEDFSINLFAKLFGGGCNLDSIPKVALHELWEKPKKGDCMTAFLKRRVFPTFKRFVASRTLGIAQGTKFNSLKFFKSPKSIIGYGVDTTKYGFTHPIYNTEASFRNYVRNAGGVIILRPKGFTEMQADKVIEFIERNKNTAYNYKDCSESAMKRLKDNLKRIFHINDSKLQYNVSKRFLEKYKKPMFCSSIIALAYKYAGFNCGLAYGDKVAWPVDFVNSDKFEKVCMFRR